MSGLKIMGVIIFTMIIFSAVMAVLTNTTSEYDIVDNNESESTGLFNMPTGQFHGVSDSIALTELEAGGVIIKFGLQLFLGFVILFWLRGTQ